MGFQSRAANRSGGGAGRTEGAEGFRSLQLRASTTRRLLARRSGAEGDAKPTVSLDSLASKRSSRPLFPRRNDSSAAPATPQGRTILSALEILFPP